MAKDEGKSTFLIYGGTGVGKTTLFRTLLRAGMRVFLWDADGQARTRIGRHPESKNLTVRPWHTYLDAAHWISEIRTAKKSPGFDAVGFDTLTILNEELIRETEPGVSEKDVKVPKWDDRGPATEKIYNILRWGRWLADPEECNFPMHVIFTAHEAIIEDRQQKGVLIYGPALPGRLVARGGALVQEMYHMVVAPEEGKPEQLNHWLVTQNDGTWPAKGSEELDLWEDADLAAILKKIHRR